MHRNRPATIVGMKAFKSYDIARTFPRYGVLTQRPPLVGSVNQYRYGVPYCYRSLPLRYGVLVRLLQDITLGAYSKIDSKFIMNGLGLGKSSL